MPNNSRQQLQYVVTGNPETVNSARIHMPGQLGRYLIVQNPNGGAPVDGGDTNYRDKEFRYVQCDSTAGAAASYRSAVAFWADKSKFIVTTDPSRQGRGQVAGVFPCVISPGNYGFIQTGGPALVKFQNPVTAAPTAAGLLCIPSAEAGHADCLAAGTAATYPILGRSISAYDTTNFTANVDLALADIP